MKSNSLLSIFLLLALFFPYIGVVSGIDTQPNFIIVCILFFPFFSRVILIITFC